MTLVAFNDYRPDVLDLNRDVLGDINNLIAADGSYIPFPQLVSYTPPLPGRPIAGITVIDADGSVYIFGATPTKIYLLNNTTRVWDDVSNGTYAATVANPWDFAVFGSFVVAVNPNNNPQVFEMGSSSAFADLAGSPPRGGSVNVWGDFLVISQIIDNPGRVHWSGLNNITQWTPGTNNSDYQDFPEGGLVQGTTDATNPIIFLQRAIYYGTFVPGSQEIFTFQKIHSNIGAKSALSIAVRGEIAFFVSEGSFYQIGPDGSTSTIGFEKVDRTIFTGMTAADIAEIRGVIDPFYNRVYWATRTKDIANYNQLIIYDWVLGKWTKADPTFVLHMPAATVGYTLDGLDSISMSLDALPYSLDSKAWQGGAPILSAFDSLDRLAFFNGAPAEATISTQEIGDTAGQVTLIQSIYPVVDTDKAYVSISSRFRRYDPAIDTDEGLPSRNTGRVLKKSRGRFHRVKVRIPKDTQWTNIQAVDVQTVPAGFR